MNEAATEQNLRDRATRRVKQKRDFYGNVAAYVVVNAFLVFIWYMAGGGYPWFLWAMAGWGIAVVIHGVQVFAMPDTGARYEREIAAEMDKMRK